MSDTVCRMICRRAFLLSGATAVLFANAALAAKARDPMAIIAEIYKSEGDRAFGTDPAARKKYLSKSLDQLWTRAEAKVNPHGDEAGAIDWDVATNSQGMEVKMVWCKYAFRDDQRALVVVTLVPKGEWDAIPGQERYPLPFHPRRRPLGDQRYRRRHRRRARGAARSVDAEFEEARTTHAARLIARGS